MAAYWLFIVLMLATFTANLAAFLTVERMQTTVQSMEELGKQSRINYTAVADSPYLQVSVSAILCMTTVRFSCFGPTDNSQAPIAFFYLVVGK